MDKWKSLIKTGEGYKLCKLMQFEYIILMHSVYMHICRTTGKLQ